MIRGRSGLDVLTFAALFPGAALAADWPQWGGRDPGRNMVSEETGLPESFVPGRKSPQGKGIAIESTENVRWAVRLGNYIYGNPTVAGGKLFAGTDDASLLDDGRLQRTGAGMIQCLDAATGKLLWRLATPKRALAEFPKGIHYGQQHLGTCSSPAVVGNRVYALTSADELVCLDVNGLADGNDGPFLDEGRYMAGPGRPVIALGPTDADVVWIYDIVKELGVCPHDVPSCSPLVHGRFVYVSTSNGVDTTHEKVLRPDVPSLIALDRETGRLAGRDAEAIGRRLFHCLWSPPSLGVVDGKALVFFGGGDGVCYAFEALTDVPAEPATLKKVWSYDCNPPEFRFRNGKPIRYTLGDVRKKESPNANDGAYVGPSEIISTPVFHRDRVYVTIGQDPSHGRGRGLLHCIDARKTGDITGPGRVWVYDAFDRSISGVAIAGGLLYATDIAGRVHCLDPETGEARWTHDLKAETWATPLVADGKVYIGTKKQLCVMAAGREPKVLAQIPLGSPSYGTPVAADGTLYVASQQYLWAVQAGARPPREAGREGAGKSVRE
jgi:outer membrane protein assembly factor BamB